MKKWRVAEKSGAVKQDKRAETEMMLFIFHLLLDVCVCDVVTTYCTNV
tara:strand:+ start:648 stop:791 length:144 start_codon:yes stop_codon:yes gene_type:complete